MEKGFDMRRWFRFPFLSLPTKFCARILMAAVWGLGMSEGEGQIRVALGAVLGGLALLLSVAFFGWDRARVDGPRMALYGLYVAGEAMVVGAFCLSFMATFCGRTEAYAMMLCGFGGSLFTVYAMKNLVAGNISKKPGGGES